MEISPNKSEKEQVLDFIRLCCRHWYYFVVSGTLCLALGILYLKTAKPVYQIASQVALRHDESLTGSVGKTSSGLLSAMGLNSGKENIEDETLKMNSQGNIKEVVKILDLNKIYNLTRFWGLFKEALYDQSPIVLSVDPALQDTLIQSIFVQMAVKKDGSASVKMKWGKKELGPYAITSFPATLQTPAGDLTFAPSPFFANHKPPFTLEISLVNNDYITQIYRKQIKIDFYKKNSDLIDLSMNSTNVEFSKGILLATIGEYNKNWDGDKEYVYNRTMSYIAQRLELAQQELIGADGQIQEFKDKYNLTDIEADVKYYFTMGGEVQGALLQSETQLKQVDITLDFFRDDNNRYSLVPYNINTSDQSIAEIITKYNVEILRRNDMRKNNAQSILLQSLESQLDSQRKNLILSLNNFKKGIQTTLETIRKKEQEINRKIGNIPSVERDYISLKRAQELQQTIYIFLLEKREETAVRSVSLMPKLKMIDKPYVVNKLVSPGRMKVILMALFFGGFIIPVSLIYGPPYWRTMKK